MSSTSHFTEPTTHYWQEILPSAAATIAPWQYRYPAKLPDGSILMLPIRPLKNDAQNAVASLLVNHASINVVVELGNMLANTIRVFEVEALQENTVEVVIGLPTLGLSLAPVVAQGLQLTRYVPLGYSKKFWYDDTLSADVSSITSPELGLKKIYLDPNLLSLVRGKRAALIDDAVSSGTTLKATWDLLESLGCHVVVVGVAMRQGHKWKEVLGETRSKKLVGVFDSPLLKAVEEGWEATT